MEQASYIIEKKLKILDLPKLLDIEGMTHRQLLKCLRYCPESKLFMQTRSDVNTRTYSFKTATILMREMVCLGLAMPEKSIIIEAERSSQEESKEVSDHQSSIQSGGGSE